MPIEALPIEYRVIPWDGQWYVVVVHNKTPDWWRVVAIFPTERRANDYCEIENMGANEWWSDGPEEKLPEDMEAAPVDVLPPLPSSAVITANMNPPTPEEKARVASALLSEAANETGTEITVSVKKPLTDKMERVWRAMIDLEKAGKRYPTHQEIADKSGVPAGSMGYMLENLIDRGYCEWSLDRVRVVRTEKAETP